MHWISKLLNKVGVDKVLHSLVCFIIAENAGLLWHIIGEPHLEDFCVGLFVAMLIGALKECYDGYTGKGSFEMADILADFVGSALGSVAVLLFSLFI